MDEAGQVFPPLLAEAFAIDRRLDLSPASPSVRESWGAITLANPDGRFDALIHDRVIDRMPIRIRSGFKIHDAERQIDLDPSSSALCPYSAGWAVPGSRIVWLCRLRCAKYRAGSMR
ncbi:hypothetical protein [Asaia prunellae]|uniref:hypothetical protein n=1 Tax=Asaia prunellae TaxID=610245 RepID=UPI000683D9EF|nr:hypothetical protein [Asaia prunellae]